MNVEDPSRWPLSRYVREVVLPLPDGKVMVGTGAVNIAVGFALLVAVVGQWTDAVRGIHPLLFLTMPIVSGIWFLRAAPMPQLWKFERLIRSPWQRCTDTLFQFLPALLPWFVLVKDLLSSE
ncbi:MAG: hypothetical protein ABI859_06715 [Pseudomonadota bacterium]